MCKLYDFPTVDITLREADLNSDSDIIGRLYAAWARDYTAAGDQCVSPNRPVSDLFSPFNKLLLAYKDHEIVGLLVLKQKFDVWVIDLVYVRQKFCGQGVATKLYHLAVKDFGACEIELTYKRVLKRVGYWQARGFKSLKGKAGQSYSYKSLCVLSVHDHWHSIYAVPLELNAIERYRQTLGCTYEFKAVAA
jgi:N-acetylglutamate synthase-like GNAT family acetyltransferase